MPLIPASPLWGAVLVFLQLVHIYRVGVSFERAGITAGTVHLFGEEEPRSHQKQSGSSSVPFIMRCLAKESNSCGSFEAGRGGALIG